MKIREAISSELELQESLNFQLPPRVLPILSYDFAALDDHERIYVPPLDDEFLPHSVTATSDTELIEIFDTLEELTGGLFPNKHSFVEHESQHAHVAQHFGQRVVRYTVRIQAFPTMRHNDSVVRPISIIPSTILEDIHTSKLGLATMLSAPPDASDSDISRMKSLGYSSRAEVNTRGRAYNLKYHSDYYPAIR